MGLLETLVLGSYLWTLIMAGALWKKIDRLETNHLSHLAAELKRLRAARRSRVRRSLHT